MRKPAFCICENKDADQLRGDREADQRLCFRYTDSTVPLLPKSEISSLWPSSVAVQPGLCRTWSKTPKTGFLRTRLNSTILSFDWTDDENNLTTPASLDQDGDDDSVAYGYGFLIICPVCLFLVFTNSLLIYIIIYNRKKT